MEVLCKCSRCDLPRPFANKTSFAVLFRFHGTDYAESFWMSGVIIIGMNLAVCWIKPLPKGQIGGK